MESSVSFCDETTIGGCGYLDIICVDSLLKTGAILKKPSVSGVAAGWFKNVRMGTFFSFLQKKKTILQNWTIFSYRKIKLREKKNAASTCFKKGHPLDLKQKFFLGWPGRLFRAADIPGLAECKCLMCSLILYILNPYTTANRISDKAMGCMVILLVYLWDNMC